MNIKEIKAIEARVEAATPAPWTHEEYGFGINAKEKNLYFAYGCDEQTFTDMEFVCHAREDIPALLDALKAKERELAAAVKTVRELCGEYGNYRRDCDNCEWRGTGKEQSDG